jgi:putative salt-induced outer membrane protein YdiY
MPKLRSLQCTAALALLLAATSARAQTPPPPAAPPPAAQYTEKVSLARPPVAHRVAGNLSAGTTLNGGNTQSYGATLGGRFQLTHDLHQLTAEALGTGAWARNVATDEVDPTARNIVGRARYDIFLTKNDALFVALAPRRDPFAGIAIRLQTQAGCLRNLYAPADNHRLWSEVGYDYTYDLFSKFRVPGQVGPLPDTAGDHEHVHSARLFLGYTNLLTPLLTANLGLEFLYDFQESDNNRVNSLIELTSSVSQRFKLSLLSRILYDQKPVEGKEKTDYVTTFQLVYTFDSFTPPPACPACDCSSEVAAAKATCAPTTSPADAVPPHEDSVARPGPLPAQPSAAPTQPVKPAP